MLKIIQKNKKSKKNKNRAVQSAAQSKIENRTRTIEVNVVTNMASIDNSKTKTRGKIKKQKNNNKSKTKVNKIKHKNTGRILKIIGMCVLVVGAIVFLCTTPLFNVTEIEVLGNENVSKEEIVSLSQIKLNENMFKNIKTTIKQNIKGNAYIENVSVKRVLPNKLQITVQERKVKFMVKHLDSYAYINSQGYILEVTSQTKEVPIIEGMSTPEEEIIVRKKIK